MTDTCGHCGRILMPARQAVELQDWKDGLTGMPISKAKIWEDIRPEAKTASVVCSGCIEIENHCRCNPKGRPILFPNNRWEFSYFTMKDAYNHKMTVSIPFSVIVMYEAAEDEELLKTYAKQKIAKSTELPEYQIVITGLKHIMDYRGR